MSTTSSKVKALLSAVSLGAVKGKDSRRLLVSALQETAHATRGQSRSIETALKEFAKLDDFPWIFSAAYWSLRREENSLPHGTIFTPPTIARKMVSQLIPGLKVVDLGAGTGMLTLTAAKLGYHVTAIEEDPEMILILDLLARILKVRDRVHLLVQSALDYKGRTDQQIMSNPPFTRHHSIGRQEKKILAKLTDRLGTPLPLTAGHHAYFMIYAWTAEWSQRETLLLPTNWIDAKYGIQLRQIMQERGPTDITILQNGDGKSVFENALTTACLVTTQRCQTSGIRPKSVPRIRIVQVHRNGGHRSRVNPYPVAKWRQMFRSNGDAKAATRYELGKLFRVKRGIATGSNSFFVLSKSAADEQGIRDNELQPILRRLSSRTTKSLVEYLWIPAKVPSKASMTLIRHGKGLDVDKQYLCAQRSPWWRIGVPHAPDYFISYMGRHKPIIKRNSRTLLNLNNIHGLFLQKGVPKKVGERVTTWLRSPRGIAALMKLSRRYQGGLWKLEPGDVQKVSIPKSLL